MRVPVLRRIAVVRRRAAPRHSARRTQTTRTGEAKPRCRRSNGSSAGLSGSAGALRPRCRTLGRERAASSAAGPGWRAHAGRQHATVSGHDTRDPACPRLVGQRRERLPRARSRQRHVTLLAPRTLRTLAPPPASLRSAPAPRAWRGTGNRTVLLQLRRALEGRLVAATPTVTSSDRRRLSGPRLAADHVADLSQSKRHHRQQV